MNEVLEQLEKIPFWKHMSDRERESTVALSAIRDYERGSILHATEGDCLGLAVVLEGSVRAFMMSEEGREITLYHIREGEHDVLTASCIMNQITFDTQMIIEAPSRILVIPATALSILKEGNIHVRSFIYESLTERFSDVMWTMQQILFYGIDQRIAALLILKAEGQGCFRGAVPEDIDTDEISGCPPIKITHEEIAREINTAREVVARVMKGFAEDGLVETGRGRIKLKDPRKLYELAGELI